MKERPILFSGPMVRAILSGSKTQTRRVVKGCVNAEWEAGACFIRDPGTHWNIGGKAVRCPYGEPGDRLWVKETHAIDGVLGLTTDPAPVMVQVEFLDGERRCVALTADESKKLRARRAWSLGDQTPGIFMFRSLSRITLKIVSVRVERLQEISEGDALAEGIFRRSPESDVMNDFRFADDSPLYRSAAGAYQALWESINGAGSWDANPWVWVVEFKKL